MCTNLMFFMWVHQPQSRHYVDQSLICWFILKYYHFHYWKRLRSELLVNMLKKECCVFELFFIAVHALQWIRNMSNIQFSLSLTLKMCDSGTDMAAVKSVADRRK